MKRPDDVRNDVAPFDHRTHAHVATRKALRNRPNNVISNHLFDRPYVLRCERVLVHERVHGRVHIRRRRGCQRAHQRCLFSFVRESEVYGDEMGLGTEGKDERGGGETYN